jgi:hypothetical protein
MGPYRSSIGCDWRAHRYPQRDMYCLAQRSVRSARTCSSCASSAHSAVGDAGIQVMNEVTLHRGQHTHLTVIDAFFDDQHLTEAVVSGLALHTSVTNSTGGWAITINAYWLDRVLPFCGRSYLTPRDRHFPAHAHSSKKLELPDGRSTGQRLSQT